MWRLGDRVSDEVYKQAREILSRRERTGKCLRAGICPRCGAKLKELGDVPHGEAFGIILKYKCSACSFVIEKADFDLLVS